MKPLTLDNVNCKYGAPMGRPQLFPENLKAKGKLQLCQVTMYDGCYDKGGAYWGMGETLYHAEGELEGEDFITRAFFRAKSRKEAKEKIRAKLPNVSFYN